MTARAAGGWMKQILEYFAQSKRDESTPKIAVKIGI
jgi:hypothetical protein